MKQKRSVAETTQGFEANRSGCSRRASGRSKWETIIDSVNALLAALDVGHLIERLRVSDDDVEPILHLRDDDRFSTAWVQSWEDVEAQKALCRLDDSQALMSARV